MAELLHLFILQLLFGSFTSSLLQIISSDYKSVHPGENITLHCNITNYSEIFWYRLRSGELEQLVSAERTKLDKDSYVVHNVNESHFDVPGSSSSVSLVIIGVNETDLGFYYCGGRNDATHTQFGKHIRLNFTADNFTKYSDAEEPAGPGLYCITDFIIIYCVCAVFVLMNIICMCTICCKVQWKSASSCRSCSNTTDSPEEEENVNYASIKYKRRPRAEDERNMESDLDSVAYAAVASGPNRT